MCRKILIVRIFLTVMFSVSFVYSCKSRSSSGLTAIDSNLKSLIEPRKVLTEEQIRVLCLRAQLTTFFFNAETGRLINRGKFPADLFLAMTEKEKKRAEFYHGELRTVREAAVRNFLSHEDECGPYLDPQSLGDRRDGHPTEYPARYVLSVVDGPGAGDSEIYWQEAATRKGPSGQYEWQILPEEKLVLSEGGELIAAGTVRGEVYWPSELNLLLKLAEDRMMRAHKPRLNEVDPSVYKFDFLTQHFFKSHAFEVMPKRSIDDLYSLYTPISWSEFDDYSGSSTSTVTTHFFHDMHDRKGAVVWDNNPDSLHYPLWSPETICSRFAPLSQDARQAFIDRCVAGAKAKLTDVFDPRKIPKNCEISEEFTQGLEDNNQGGFDDGDQGGFGDHDQGVGGSSLDEILFEAFMESPVGQQSSPHLLQGQRGVLVKTSELDRVEAEASFWLGYGTAITGTFIGKDAKGEWNQALQFPERVDTWGKDVTGKFFGRPVARTIVLDSCSMHFARSSQTSSWETHPLFGTIFYSPFPLSIRAIDHSIMRPLDWRSLEVSLKGGSKDLKLAIEKVLSGGELHQSQMSCRVYADQYASRELSHNDRLTSLLSIDAEHDYKVYLDRLDMNFVLGSLGVVLKSEQQISDYAPLLRLAFSRLRESEYTAFTNNQVGNILLNPWVIYNALASDQSVLTEERKRHIADFFVRRLKMGERGSELNPTFAKADEWMIRAAFLSLRSRFSRAASAYGRIPDEEFFLGILKAVHADPVFQYYSEDFKKAVEQGIEIENKYLESLKTLPNKNRYVFNFFENNKPLPAFEEYLLVLEGIALIGQK